VGEPIEAACPLASRRLCCGDEGERPVGESMRFGVVVCDSTTVQVNRLLPRSSNGPDAAGSPTEKDGQTQPLRLCWRKEAEALVPPRLPRAERGGSEI